MSLADKTDKIDKTECEQFRSEYKKFVSAIDAKIVAETLIRKGSLHTRIHFIKQMEQSGIKIPQILTND